ncbi:MULTISPECIES: histidine kinase dimerization/phosphoacceptor domain -containing protein [unclassified Sphingomonas]|uniref:sensor histidine kinase n=1 Tax=unclassified Sphingomonas TaxID=196159 RepID=UPI000E735FA1|nr:MULTISPECIES: histidine kinase dimerization/phosphoacceptor domain -containing protein [unclassified Sphingomonas]RKE43687.1 two-component sensor histidine kinase [Sphingomonas sp. PP-CC-1A-547]TCM05913.1 two-component sensor histidine kinase [Sphingomonas sp. PP-CC-3G-468]
MSETRVLYIDDDAGIRRLAARALERRGYRMTVAETGAEGVVKAAAERFDLIAVDHYMPGMDGLETLEALRRLPDPPPVVYVTGSEEGRIAVAALKAGAADYVVKTIGEDFFDLLAASFEQVRARALLEQEKASAEADLRASNARLEALLGEVNHRVANSLQLVSAMVRLQATALTDPSAREALEDTQRRIQAIAQVHRRLYTSNDVESVDMQEYLGALVDELAETWSTEALPRALTLAAEPIRLPTDRAVSLGVIVTELVTNACKYAYPDSGGEVRVALRRIDDDVFLLAVEDDGCGIPEDAVPRGTGLGTKLIRAMAQSLQSIVEYDPTHTGVRATLRAVVR